MTHTWVDGVETDVIPNDDRGLNYADGVFETLACDAGRIGCAELHLLRLIDGLSRLRFNDADLTARRIFREALALILKVKHTGAARLTVTRGSGPRGYSPPSRCLPRYVLTTASRLPLSSSALRCGIASMCWSANIQLAGIKSLARVEQVLAALEAQRQGWDDVIMLDEAGGVISSSKGNLFLLNGNRALTPALDHCGIAGTRRQLLMETVLPDSGYGVHVDTVSLDALLSAESVIICNTIIGARPVLQVGDRTFEAGPRCAEIQSRLSACIAACVG